MYFDHILLLVIYTNALSLSSSFYVTSSTDIESENEDRPSWTGKHSTPRKLHSMSDYHDVERE